MTAGALSPRPPPSITHIHGIRPFIERREGLVLSPTANKWLHILLLLASQVPRVIPDEQRAAHREHEECASCQGSDDLLRRRRHPSTLALLR